MIFIIIPLYSRIILFADDTTIFNSHLSSKYLQYMMEHDLNLMTSWFCANKLSLNLVKTVAIKFWNNKRNFQLHVNNSSIPIVNNTKFLGVHLDNQIAWTVHINALLDKIHLNRQMLTLGKNLLDRNSLRSVYFGHIHSHLNCGLTVWGSMLSVTQLSVLQKVQVECINIVAGARNEFKQLHVLSVNQLIQNSLCKMGHKVSHRCLPEPLLKIFNMNGGQKVHRYPTRNKHIPNIQRHQDIRFNKSFLCRSIREFGHLPDYLKKEKNTIKFDKVLKKYIAAS